MQEKHNNTTPTTVMGTVDGAPEWAIAMASEISERIDQVTALQEQMDMPVTSPTIDPESIKRIPAKRFLVNPVRAVRAEHQRRSAIYTKKRLCATNIGRTYFDTVVRQQSSNLVHGELGED